MSIQSCSPRKQGIRALLILAAIMCCVTQLTLAREPGSVQAVPVSPGWNLLSLPACVDNGSKELLFPSSISPAYIFRTQSGYLAEDTLCHGMGFWLKFTSADTVYIEGSVVFADTIEVQAGWNLIGSLSMPVAVGAIQTEPPGIISSQFFGYTPGAGYDDVDTLQPARGYWVKVSQEGSLILQSAGMPCPGIQTVDYAGKTYNTVQIGNQCWLRENLDVGDMVLGVQNQTNNSILEKYCYGNDAVNCDAYGGLYQWDEAMQYSTTPGVQGICPPGWHIPTSAEFQTLGATVNGDGNALKEIGEGSGDGAGTNTSGFSGLLAGVRHDGGVPFADFGGGAYIWGSTSLSPADRHGLYLYSGDAEIGLGTHRYWYGLSVRCLKTEAPNLPPDAPSHPIPDSGGTNVWTSPTLRWSCSDPEGDPLTYDVYFGTDNPPATLVASDHADTNLVRTGLASGTPYYWRVVARDNHANSTASPVWSFTTQTGGGEPCPGVPTVTYAGKTYNTVQIGSQCWLRENLNVGSMLPDSLEQSDNDSIEKHCYNDNPASCELYGGLYTWDEMMQYASTPGGRGICPPGWHVPTNGEFETLSGTVGYYASALKEIGEGGGTNVSGFSALVAGLRGIGGGFSGLYSVVFFWSSTAYPIPGSAYALYLNANTDTIYLLEYAKSYGFYVRCLKD